MEKQEFLMEICEISNGGSSSDGMKNAAITILKEGITATARRGLRQIQITGAYNINLSGVQMQIPLIAGMDYLREQGFTVVDNANGCWTISW